MRGQRRSCRVRGNTCSRWHKELLAKLGLTSSCPQSLAS
ncbi:rCG53241 [Rattus norvegicus]|uniref:RCG53241 n=1 Tax=Rattus norvegicus TaxID=10116 RepID=A6JMR9_RAT|nr:rCG53241 [Rattus norvegicus]